MSLQEKRERFKYQQKSSGYISCENSSVGDADIVDIEIQSKKEDSAILSSCLEGKNSTIDACGVPKLSQNEVNEVDNSTDMRLSVDINDSKWDGGASTALRCCKEPGISSDINNSEADEELGTAVDNSSKMGRSSELDMSKAKAKKDNETDKCEILLYKVQDDVDSEKECIKLKPRCKSEGTKPAVDAIDSVELISIKTKTDSIVANDGINSEKRAFSKSHGLHLNTTVSESSVNNTAEAIGQIRSQSVSSDDYRVEQAQLKEKDVVPSKHPQLCTTPTADSHHCVAGAFKQAKEYCDGQRSSISSSASSLASNMSDYKIMKRHSAVVKIDEHTNFFKVQTVKYVHHRKKSKQHYMKQLHDKDKEIEGNIGLRPGDLLLKAQEKSLENRSQKDVLRIFKKTEPDKNGKIRIKMVFRRWEPREEDGTKRTYEVDYKLKLVLAPDSPDSTPETQQRRSVFQKHRGRLNRQYTFKVEKLTQKETGWKTEVPKGQIDAITSRGQVKQRIQPVYFGNEQFVTADHDGLPSLKAWDGTTASENVFTFSYFRGMDRSQEPLTMYAYCTRISCPGPTGVRYLTSHLQSHNELIFKTSTIQKVTAPDDVDETCFILREIGREVLFESLLHRGFYVGCRGGKDGSVSFAMIKKPKHDVINGDNLENVTFKQWPVKEEQGSGVFTQATKVVQSLFSCAGNRSS